MERYKKIIIPFLVMFVIIVILAVSGCQQVFTYSPFSSFLQRPIASLPAEQQIQYAEDVLASGDTDAMGDAYDAVTTLLDSAEPGSEEAGNLNLLAADLAIGASGITDVLGALDTSAGLDALNDVLDSLDTDMLSNVATNIAAANSNPNVTVSSSQYVNAGASLIFQAAADAGGFENVDWTNDPDVAQAMEYADLGGVDIQSLLGG